MHTIPVQNRATAIISIRLVLICLILLFMEFIPLGATVRKETGKLLKTP